MDFNPDDFLNQTSTEANDTEYQLVPEGEPLAIVEKVTTKTGVISSGDNMGEAYVMAGVVWDIDDQAIKAEMDRSKVTITQNIMLDIKEDTGVNGVPVQLDFGKGKNVALGRVREALGLNTPGQPWSFAMFPGRQAKIKIKHVPDKKEPGKVRSNVTDVVKVG